MVVDVRLLGVVLLLLALVVAVDEERVVVGVAVVVRAMRELAQWPAGVVVGDVVVVVGVGGRRVGVLLLARLVADRRLGRARSGRHDSPLLMSPRHAVLQTGCHRAVLTSGLGS